MCRLAPQEGIMPHESSDLSHAPHETPAGLRLLAARARRLAEATLDQQTENNLTAFAADLEGRAATLESAPQTVLRADPDLGQS